jgi:hypothetical protein
MEADLRKLAADIVGRGHLEERFGTPRLSAVDIVLLHKMASADQELLAIAGSLSNYEKLGGEYKAAVSIQGVRQAVSSAKATPDRLEKFIDKVVDTGRKAWDKPVTSPGYYPRELVREEAVRSAIHHPARKGT